MRFIIPLTVIFQLCIALPLNAQDTTSVYDDIEFTLNDGHKWILNEGMHHFIHKSFDLIEKHDGDVNKRKTAKKLLKLADKFIENCSIEGEGHHMIHHWLTPYIDLLEALQTEEYIEDQPVLWKEILHARDVFHNYFE